ncbi:hypothetical protein C9J01_24310 [Photobacterium rosenbergii]|uniref:HEPN domain-containing protein n=1 Tax=Photobacterium rosenbergii TaxID=294936 RepID=A0A2T3N6E6_9GAMM|nr:hypothetical protein [Photobacterium rosenbergii]PSW08297.1 hypothetical protein C9J01_24310 [Photobacterium rosenbergii]
MSEMHEYSKVKIALEYLEAAVDEYDLHSRYFTSMNLACVSEELLGKFVRVLTGKPDRHSESVDNLLKIQEKIDFGFNDRKKLQKLLLNGKNTIKHMDNAADSMAKLYYPIEVEAFWAIECAVENIKLLDIPIPDEVQAFLDSYERPV